MPYQTWIFDAAKATGYPVVEVDGWQTRGSSTFDPRGLVWHHTAGPSTGDAPTLNLVVNGRSDLPGPLSQFVLGRSGTIYVVAAGRANHAGEGGWRGLSGNSSVFGIEAEHVGRTGVAWPDVQLDAYLKLSAELAKRGGFTADMVCGHKEWAPTRKVDPIDLDMNDMRRRIAQTMEGGVRVFLPILRKDAVARKSDVALVARLCNVVYGSALPTDGSWGDDMAATLIANLGEDGERVTGQMYANLLVDLADSRAGADTELREAYNTHRHPGLLSPAPRAEDKV